MKQKVFSNIIWRFAERVGAQLIGFVLSVILARILEPSAYGEVALITAFLSILQVFVDGGLGNALIQKKDADALDFSSVFYFNVVFCAVIYAGTFLAAPYIASFYRNDSLTPMIRVMCIMILISGVENVQQAYVSRTLQFKKFFFTTLIGTVLSAVIGIIMALRGFGVWALIAQTLINGIIDTILVWTIVKWRPQRIFSIKRVMSLFSYGWKLLASNLLNTVYSNIRQLIIGRLYSSEELAYYNRGRNVPNLIVANVNTSIDSVLFPVMSAKQDDKAEMKNMVRRAIMTSNYIMAPLMIGLASIAEPVIRLIFTEKWLPCVPYLRIFCIIYVFQPIHTANTNAIKAMGRSDVFLKLEIIKKVIEIAILLASVRFGVMVIAYSYLANTVLNQVINSWPNWKMLNYKYLEQLRDILPSTLLAVGMGICVYGISLFGWNDLLTVAVQVLLGAALYALGSVIFKLEAFRYLWDILKEFWRKNHEPADKPLQESDSKA